MTYVPITRHFRDRTSDVPSPISRRMLRGIVESSPSSPSPPSRRGQAIGSRELFADWTTRATRDLVETALFASATRLRGCVSGHPASLMGHGRSARWRPRAVRDVSDAMAFSLLPPRPRPQGPEPTRPTERRLQGAEPTGEGEAPDDA
jgi:hypothetical protein